MQPAGLMQIEPPSDVLYGPLRHARERFSFGAPCEITPGTVSDRHAGAADNRELVFSPEESKE